MCFKPQQPHHAIKNKNQPQRHGVVVPIAANFISELHAASNSKTHLRIAAAAVCSDMENVAGLRRRSPFVLLWRS